RHAVQRALPGVYERHSDVEYSRAETVPRVGEDLRDVLQAVGIRSVLLGEELRVHVQHPQPRVLLAQLRPRQDCLPERRVHSAPAAGVGAHPRLPLHLPSADGRDHDPLPRAPARGPRVRRLQGDALLQS
ncbi:CBN-NHR-1 protein, partial [Aphelenchoides avenae]